MSSSTCSICQISTPDTLPDTSQQGFVSSPGIKADIFWLLGKCVKHYIGIIINAHPPSKKKERNNTHIFCDWVKPETNLSRERAGRQARIIYLHLYESASGYLKNKLHESINIKSSMHGNCNWKGKLCPKIQSQHAKTCYDLQNVSRAVICLCWYILQVMTWGVHAVNLHLRPCRTSHQQSFCLI